MDEDGDGAGPENADSCRDLQATKERSATRARMATAFMKQRIAGAQFIYRKPPELKNVRGPVR